jgi:hypothetical protein
LFKAIDKFAERGRIKSIQWPELFLKKSWECY